MGEQQQERTPESLRHEYTEVLQNIRHYANMRFAAFSVFVAITAGVGIVAFGKGQFGEHADVMARIAGVFVIAIFWLFEERLAEMFEHFVRMAIELERALGYKQWTARPVGAGHFPRPRVMWRMFYFLVTLLWVFAAFAVPLGS